MLRRFFKKLNNKAFTLIEILLAVGLLAIASVSIGAIIVSTQNNTTKMFSEAELQQQMVEVQETLHNEILATSEGIGYWSRNSDGQAFTRTNAGDTDAFEQLIAFYNLDTKDYVLNKTYYKWNSEDRVLYVANLQQTIEKDTINDIVVEVDKNISDSLAQIGNNWTLVASNVEEMSVDLTNYGKNRLVSFNMEIKQDESSYPIDDTIYLRNSIDVNSDTLTIEKYHTIKLPKPTLENAMFVYDGKSHGPNEIDYLERYIERTSDSVLVAKDAGTYVVTYKLKDKDGTKWEDGSTADVTLTWVIQQRVVNLVWGETTWIYDGQKHYTTCRATNVIEGDTCEIKLANNSVGPDVGSVECTAACANKNYTVPNVNTVTLKIQKSQPTVTINVAHKTYNGSAQSMVSYSNLVGGTLRFYISTSGTTPAAVNNTSCLATDAGTYHIWYRIVADNSGNYSDSDVFYLGTAKMNRSKTATASGLSLVYNQAYQNGVTGNGVDWDGTTSAKNAGTYNAYATPDSNHLWSNGGDERRTVTWTIDKATGNVTKPTAVTGLIYNGSAQTLVNAGSTSYGYVAYKLDNGTFSSSVPTAVNAGTYTVYYYSVGDSNHYPTAVQSLQVTIERQRSAYATGKSLVYNGNYQNGVSADHVSITGTTSAKDVETYQFKATPVDNYAWSNGGIEERTVSWYITKADGTVSTAPTAKTLVYNGNAQTLVNAGTTSTGIMYYSLTQNGTYSTSIPTGTNAGDYTVYYYSKGDDNHNNTTVGSVKVTISRNPASTAAAANKTYNGDSQTGVTGAYVDWSGDTTGTNVNTYTAYATPTTNYCWKDNSGTEKRTVTWTISKAVGQVTAPTAKDLTYNGNAQTLINAGSSTTGTVYYKLSGGTYSTNLPTGTNAGDYTVYYYSKGDGNHSDTSEFSIKVTIKRNTSATASGQTLSYTGSSQTGVTGSYVSWTNNSTKTATNVGTYYAYATPIDNYAWSDGTTGQKTISWTISKVAGSITAPTAKTLTYNGSAQALVNAGSSSTGTVYYCLTQNGTYSTSIPTGTDAGDYTVYYYSKGDGNHNNTTVGSVKVTIAKNNGATAAAANKTYNGYSQTGVTGSNVSWSSSGTTSAINAGTYSAYATPNTNYTWSNGGAETRTITWYIYRSNAASAAATNYTYDGYSHTGANGSYVSWTGTRTASSAGTYSAYATPNANYAWSNSGTETRTITWYIYRLADHKFTVANHTYDGSQKWGYDGNNSVGYACSWSGTWTATNAGTYQYTMTPDANHAWTDGSTGAKTFTWYIYRSNTASASGGTYNYTGGSITGVSGSYVNWSGITSASGSGTYTAYATPDANHAWSNGGTETRTITWKINGYIFKVGNGAITRSTCKAGCDKNGIYNSAGNARSHSGKQENLSTDRQTFTVKYIYDSTYRDSVTGPTSIGAYALHPQSYFCHPTTGAYCTPEGWVPAENCEA